MKPIIGILVLINVLVAASPAIAGQGAGTAQGHGSWPNISLALKVKGMDKITHIANAGDNSGRLFVVEQRGRIIIIKGNAPQKTPFLNIADRVSCCGERGLLSVVFPYDYADKRYVYVDYTDRSGDTVVSRFHLTADPDRADPRSEEIILTVKQPFSNHNGGQLAFGPDGFLYIGLGDGGSAGDPYNNGQNPGSLLGKILRIDTETGIRPYAIPPGNPFANRKGHRPEIWAMGLRNPWRFSFDRLAGDLFIADVGQNRYEEVDFQPKSSAGGENYGWNIMEGNHCYKSKKCDSAGLVPPVAEYDHSRGCSITGGMVYRGKQFPALLGIYLYGDYCSGRIWGLRRSGSGWEHEQLIDSKLAISTFGEDENGGLYVADYDKGSVLKIEAGSKP
jgi:glucose/arabinose dehydrogenase